MTETSNHASFDQARLSILHLGRDLGIPAVDLLAWAKEVAEWLVAPTPAPKKRHWTKEKREAAAAVMRQMNVKKAADRVAAKQTQARADAFARAGAPSSAAVPEPAKKQIATAAADARRLPDQPPAPESIPSGAIFGSLSDVLAWRKREGDVVVRLDDGTFRVNGSSIQDLPTLLRRTNNLRRSQKLPPLTIEGVSEAP